MKKLKTKSTRPELVLPSGGKSKIIPTHNIIDHQLKTPDCEMSTSFTDFSGSLRTCRINLPDYLDYLNRVGSNGLE